MNTISKLTMTDFLWIDHAADGVTMQAQSQAAVEWLAQFPSRDIDNDGWINEGAPQCVRWYGFGSHTTQAYDLRSHLEANGMTFRRVLR